MIRTYVPSHDQADGRDGLDDAAANLAGAAGDLADPADLDAAADPAEAADLQRHPSRTPNSRRSRRERQEFRCQVCGQSTSQWVGRCHGCGEWGSVVECEPATPDAGARVVPAAQAVSIVELSAEGAVRLACGISELDRVLGGGLMAGSVTLLAGEPGTGKSTIALQAAAGLARAGAVLVVSGEESVEQVRARAGRLGAVDRNVMLVAESSLESTLAHIESVRPRVVLVDSVQTLQSAEVSGVAGSVNQVRECATQLVRTAKQNGIAVVLVGHVTKDGAVAGPRLLEHIVDTVLSFEGERHQTLRMLRLLKHRFGPTDELGLFQITATGLRELEDPSGCFLADRRTGTPGSVVGAALASGRPLLVEVQALVARTLNGAPRRSAQGLDARRLEMLLAVLDERVGVTVGTGDVYVSVAGGLRVGGPELDVATVLSIVSAARGVALPDDLVVAGEVGLGGELRQVPQLDRRLGEAARLGFRAAVVPASCPPVQGLALRRASDVHEALSAAGLHGDD